MSAKLVTSRQTDSVRDMANDKGVTRQEFQGALYDGRVARFLDSLKLTPPEGARIHQIHVRIKLDREWQEAVNVAGPNTPDSYNVRKVGDLFLPTGVGEIEKDLVMLNYKSGGGSWDKALEWAQSKGLKKTVPREVCAIGENHTVIHHELGVNPMVAVATTECTFEGSQRACYVWWCDSDRMLRLGELEDFSYSNDWFVFSK